MTHAQKSFVCLLDLDSLERISIAVHARDISIKFEEAKRIILRRHDGKRNGNLAG